MTDEQILELAKTCGFDKFQRRKYDGKSDYGIHWECWEEQLLKFARAIRQDGYTEGYDDGMWQADYNSSIVADSGI